MITFNSRSTTKNYMIATVLSLVVFVIYSSIGHSTAVPSAYSIISSYPSLMKDDNLIGEFMSSSFLYLHTMFLSTIFAFAVSYLSTLKVKEIPLFRPIVEFICKLRSVSLVGLLMMFTVLTPNGYWLKVAMMSFSVIPWLVTAMVSVIDAIPQSKFEYAQTLRLSEWKIFYHCVIRGEMGSMIEACRQVYVMGILFLPTAEKLCKGDGGIGFLLTGLERFQTFDKIWAIQLLVLSMAFFQDFVIKQVVDCFSHKDNK